MVVQAVRSGAASASGSARLMRETNRALAHMTQVIAAQTTATIQERERIWNELIDGTRRTDQAMVNRRMGLHDFPQQPQAWLETLIATTQEALGCSRAEAITILKSTCLKEPRHEPARDPEAAERNGSSRGGSA